MKDLNEMIEVSEMIGSVKYLIAEETRKKRRVGEDEDFVLFFKIVL